MAIIVACNICRIFSDCGQSENHTGILGVLMKIKKFIPFVCVLLLFSIKAVQGDTGHASPKMVTEQYSRIRDLDRRRLAGLMEQAYFGGSTAPKITPDEDAALSMLRENPEVLKLLLAMKK